MPRWHHAGWQPARWALWTVPVSARVYVLIAHTAVGIATVSVLEHFHPDRGADVRFAILTALGVGYALAVDRVSLLRRFLQLGAGPNVWTNQTSIWTFAATLVLPLAYTVILVLVIYAYVLMRGWQNKSIRTYRVLFAVTTTLVGVYSASALGRLFDSVPLAGGARAEIGVVCQLGVYTLSSLAVAVVGLRLYGNTGSLRASLPRHKPVLMELGTLLLGIVAAQLLVHDVLLSPLTVLMAIALHRSSMVQELAAAARVDVKTGLLNAAAWRQRAEEILAECRGRSHSATLFVLDLDHFKRVNDTYGHIAGDAVLGAVGASLVTPIRVGDCAGRFGGEEFVLLIRDVEPSSALKIAERIRAEIATRSGSLGTPVTASIGIVTATRGDMRTLDALLDAADTALYRAKAAGRDQTLYASA